jgi:CBS domain containing-hemolysin-like protein
VTLLVTNEFGSDSVGLATGIMTFLVLTFGEIVPKTFATRFAVSFAIFSSVPLYILQFALLPFSIFFEGMSKLLHSVLKSGTISATETEEELTSLARLGYKKGRMEDLEYEVIRRIFTLNDTRVSKAMTKKENIFTLNGDDTLLSAIKQIRKHHFSRIPVYVDSQDNIKGFLYVRDIVTLPREKWSDIRVKNYTRPVIYVRPSTVLSDLYEDFIYKRTHMAIVRDKQKKVVGLITIEDIIEELVGEIEDETDTEAQQT